MGARAGSGRGTARASPATPVMRLGIPMDAEAAVAAAVAQFSAERPGMTLVEDQGVFRFDIETCLLTRTTGHGDPAPRHEIWHATA